MAKYYENLGECVPDNLICGTEVRPIVGTATIRKLAAAGTLKRGTVLSASSGTAGDKKLVVLGTAATTNETLTPYGVLCDDVEVGTSEDVVAAVYLAGHFNKNALTVADSYTMTDDDIKSLRDGGIFLDTRMSI